MQLSLSVSYFFSANDASFLNYDENLNERVQKL